MKFVCSFFVAAALLSAAPTTYNVQFVSGGSPDTNIGPYTLSINGKDVLALCIDGLVVNKSNNWTAYESPVNGSIANTYFPTSPVYYEEEAYLYSLIVAPGTTAEQRKEIQEAAWDLTNNGAYSDVGSNPNYLTMAGNNYNTIKFAGYEVVSYIYGYGKYQEFIIDPPPSAPEPASYALLGVGLLMAGAAREWASRRKQLPVVVR